MVLAHPSTGRSCCESHSLLLRNSELSTQTKAAADCYRRSNREPNARQARRAANEFDRIESLADSRKYFFGIPVYEKWECDRDESQRNNFPHSSYNDAMSFGQAFNSLDRSGSGAYE